MSLSRPNFVNEIACGLKVAGTISGYIIGSMLLIGSIGYSVDRYFNTSHKALLLSLGIAFVVSNVLVFRNARKIADKFITTHGN
ncbi:MAG: hypothetical protein WCW27_00445 [Patescibacteria group bacterium]|jgi:F0F1-type ATP synthase assembly protein I